MDKDNDYTKFQEFFETMKKIDILENKVAVLEQKINMLTQIMVGMFIAIMISFIVRDPNIYTVIMMAIISFSFIVAMLLLKRKNNGFKKKLLG